MFRRIRQGCGAVAALGSVLAAGCTEPRPIGAAPTSPRLTLPVRAPDLPEDWPALAPDGFVLADRHWTRDGQLWMLLQPDAATGHTKPKLRVCVLGTSLTTASCRDLPGEVPMAPTGDVDFAQDDAPIVVGPSADGRHRIGVSAVSGEAVAVRGMPGLESHTGLAVERSDSRHYLVLELREGRPTRQATLAIKPICGLEPTDERLPRPVIVGDEVGWLEEVQWGGDPDVAVFAKLTASGLARHQVGRISGCGIIPCRAGNGWIVTLSGLSDRVVFYDGGVWSRPILGELDLMGAGPAYMGPACRGNVQIDTAAMDFRGSLQVEERRCTRQRCDNERVSWPAAEPLSFLLVLNLGVSDGAGKTVVAWQDRDETVRVRMAPIGELPTAAEQRFTVPRGMRFAPRKAWTLTERQVILRDGVALVVFSHGALRALRVDVEGHVGPVGVRDD